jgi:hypothetical protein
VSVSYKIHHTVSSQNENLCPQSMVGIILATQEVDIRRIMIGGQPGPKLARLHFLDGTGEHHSERGQPGPEDQKSYVLPYMWTLDLGQIEQCCWTWIIRQEENKDGT